MTLETEQALLFLRAHQPMPSDHEITDDEAATFFAILQHFTTKHDARCLPLLIHSVSPGTGMGMYEHIESVLVAHPREQVLPHLQHGLVAGNAGVLYRCCWWAADLSAWELVEQIQPLTTHPDEDIQSAAQAFLELRSAVISD
jgi:hypothetical protein